MKKIVWYMLLAGSIIFGLHYYVTQKRKKQRVLSVLAWQGTFDRALVREFEKLTGIVVHVSHYSTNEELLTKLTLTHGYGVDLLVPSDYLVTRLHKENYIQPLDTSRIEAFEFFYKKLIDPVIWDEIVYAVPLEWGIYGIGVHPDWYTTYTQNSTEITKTFLYPYSADVPVRVCMTNDSNTAFSFAYFMSINDIFKTDTTLNQSDNVIEILKKQKKQVVIYSDNKLGYLLSTAGIDMAYMQSDEFLRSLKDVPHLRFYLPPSGTIKTVEYAAIFRDSEHVDEAYEFLNFMLSKPVIERNIKALCYLPSRKDLENSKVLSQFAREFLHLMNSESYKLYSVFNVFPEDVRLKHWISIKST